MCLAVRTVFLVLQPWNSFLLVTILCANSLKWGNGIGSCESDFPGENDQVSKSRSCLSIPCFGWGIDFGSHKVVLASGFIHGRRGNTEFVGDGVGSAVGAVGSWSSKESAIMS